jgi:ATP-dependent Clp protease adaptor protein ClpS
MGKKKHQEEGEVLTKEDVRTEEPPMWRVILLNDNYTSMEFVVMVLQTIFYKSSIEAKSIMLAVHEKGAGVAGIYTKEIAETKVASVHHFARQSEFPLKCLMEPVE